MKYINKYGSLVIIALMAFFTISCTEEMSEIRLDPGMATTQSMDIGSDTAVVEGFVIAEGSGITERGICYSKSENPTVDDNKVVYEGEAENAAFSLTLRDLDYATVYYARAYGVGENGVIYGEQLNFTTKPVVPTLTTTEITEITGSSAKSGGNVTVAGGADVTARGVCYSTEENPTTEDGKTEDGEGLGEFESNLTELAGNTTYYVRAYATNSAGVGYGPEVTFTTPVDAPVVVTSSVVNITKTSATLEGEVTYDGGGTVAARGLVWGVTGDPTLEADNVITSGDGVGVFFEELEGLTINTTYHVRAYATNEYGTTYGENISFTTLADITKFWVVGDYNGWDNSENADYIISTTDSEGLAEGYVYLTEGGIKLTTDHSWSDPATFGDDGAGGLTNPGDNIPVPADGYYRIQANQSDMTYSLIAMEWGVIGDATPEGWGGETPLTYDTSMEIWKGAVHFGEGEFKFRANDDWAYNYGSDEADGTLIADGGNIPVDAEADYAITLDLSNPNEYTYSANRWGVIGSATPGGWDEDTDMTWDETNQVFSVTIDMVEGEFKFRANDDWAINLGGDLNDLVQDGANIPIGEAGSYTITFDPWAMVATLTKN